MSVRRIRIWLVGFGTVGRALARALVEDTDEIRSVHGFDPVIVAIANRSDGFIFDADGIDVPMALERRDTGQALDDVPGDRHATALEGIQETEADVLVETSLSPAPDGEPGLTHMREALGRSIPVVTSNKWPVAIAGAGLAALARTRGVAFRAESTVLSGTPVLGPLTEGLAGARPYAIRGVLNATANFMLDRIAAGDAYDDALAEAQRLGLAEPDPSADVDGHDAASKLMVLSALVLGRGIDRAAMSCRGISELTADEAAAASRPDRALREVGTLSVLESGEVEARVEPTLLGLDDPLARIEGTTNAVECECPSLGTVRISGPGAGPELAGQGAFSDLMTVGRELARR